MTNMSVASATAGYGNAIYRNNPPQTTGGFDNILQQQSKNIAETNPETPEKLEVKVSEREFKITYFPDDPELEAYVVQLALENGIRKGLDMGKRNDFEYHVSQLLEQGLISRQDIIDAVKYPPQIDKHPSGQIHATFDMNGFGTSRENIEFTSTMELFEKLWGERKASKQQSTTALDSYLGKTESEGTKARVVRVINLNEMSYIRRLAVEMGIEDAQEVQEFEKTMLNLLDKGLMTFQDLEDAVKVPPPLVEDIKGTLIRVETKEEIDAKAEGIESTLIRKFLENLWELKQIAKEGKSSKWANVFDKILNLLA